MMRRNTVGATLLAAFVPMLGSGTAAASEYTSIVCMTGSLRSTDIALRGMENYGCRSDASVTTGNEVAGPRVSRGARAEVALHALAGTHFASVKWTGRARRADCRYALQVWADGPGVAPIPIFNLPANEGCPKKRGASQFKTITAREVPLYGATRLVQRVTCASAPRRSSCSNSRRTYVRSTRIELQIKDISPPVPVIETTTTPIGRGEWVRGKQRLRYRVEENVGLTGASALFGHQLVGSDEDNPCYPRNHLGNFGAQGPCALAGGEVQIDTTRMPEGSHPIAVTVRDVGGNFGTSPAVVTRIDNTPPGRVSPSVEGGLAWRGRGDFNITWANPAEADRAPIAAAKYRLCPALGGQCRTGEHVGANISAFGVVVPSPGEWVLSMWRQDAAGNQTDIATSVPVPLRYDPDPPVVAFEDRSSTDPTMVAAKVWDAVSGVAEGTIEMRAVGSGLWRPLPVQRAGNRLVGRIDDSGLPAGRYELRARAFDHARNEGTTEAGKSGRSFTTQLPLRVIAGLQTAFERERTIRETVRRNGRPRQVGRRVVVQSQTARVRFGETAQVAGRLVDPAGVGVPGADVHVLATPPLGIEQQIGTVTTDADGRFRYMAAGSTNRTLRFVYAGSPVVLPAESRLTMTVPAAVDLKVNRTRLRNGQAVRFSGPVMTLPTPPGGKLIEMQVRLPGRWETFRTIRSDDAGRWSVRYRFRRTSGVQYYRFRARMPAEGSYPYVAGISRAVTVRVRGA